MAVLAGLLATDGSPSKARNLRRCPFNTDPTSVTTGLTLVDTADVVRVLETSHPPTYYLPRAAFAEGVLVPASRRTICEWKGTARYVDLVVPGAAPVREAGWWYPTPDHRYPGLTDRVALYPALLEEVTVDGEQVVPQPGGFYGGWITANLKGFRV